MGDMAEDSFDEAMRGEWEGKFNKTWKKEIFKKMEFTGRVAKIIKDTIKSGDNIGKPYYKVTMEDSEGEQVMFSAWDYPAIAGIQVGQSAVLDYGESKDKRYKHINHALPIQDINDDIPFDGKKAIEDPPPARKANQAYQPDARELSIIRQSALYQAVQYDKNAEDDIETIIEHAKRFVEFDLTGE
jgi:hypothetical protein